MHDSLHENIEAVGIDEAETGWAEEEEEEEEEAQVKIRPVVTNAQCPPFSQAVLSDRCVHVW